MSRVEEKNTKVENLEDEINRLKKGLKRKENKRLLSCGNCLVTILLLLLFGGIYLAYLVSLTGLWQVPFFSQKFYHEPQPVYVVDSSGVTASQKDLYNLLKKEVTEAGLTLGKAGDFSVFLELSEEQLTAILRDKIYENETMAKKVEYAQASISDDNIEIYIKNNDPSNLVLTINVEPRINDGKLDLKIVGFKLGLLKLPNFLGNITLAYMSEKTINSFLTVLSSYGQIKNIDLNQGEMILEIFINDIKSII